MSISKLKLSIINLFNNVAQDTSGLVLCCTNDANGEPVIHRVIATQSIVSLLCELKRAGTRRARKVCYAQGVGSLYEYVKVRKSWKHPKGFEYRQKIGFDENEVFLKVLPYSFSSAIDMNMRNLKYAFTEYNVFSIEDAEIALAEEDARLEQEEQEKETLVKKNELESLLQNLDEEQFETLKEFVFNNDSLCNDIIESVMKRLKM